MHVLLLDVYFIIFEKFLQGLRFRSAFKGLRIYRLRSLLSSLRFCNICKLSYLENTNYFCLLLDFDKQGKVEAAAALVFQIQNFCLA